MEHVLFAELAIFLLLQAIFQLLLVFPRKIVGVLTLGALHFYHVFLRHTESTIG